MSKFSPVVLSELSEEEKAKLFDMYHILWNISTKPEKLKNQDVLHNDFVKPMLKEIGADEDSIYRYTLTGFILGVNAGIEYDSFFSEYLEKES